MTNMVVSVNHIICIYIYIYIYIRTYIVCRDAGWPPPMQNPGYATDRFTCVIIINVYIMCMLLITKLSYTISGNKIKN